MFSEGKKNRFAKAGSRWRDEFNKGPQKLLESFQSERELNFYVYNKT
jgi:hypothetical protein